MLILTIVAVAVFLFLIYSMCEVSGRESEREEHRLLTEWRAGLQRKDLVRVGGTVYRVECIEGNIFEVSNHSDTTFVLARDVYPVD